MCNDLAYFWSCSIMWSVNQWRRNSMSAAFDIVLPAWIFSCSSHLRGQHAMLHDVLGEQLVALLPHQIFLEAEVPLCVRHQIID